MNTTGFIRGYMAKNMEKEKFFDHVLGIIKDELLEWDAHIRVEITKPEDYQLIVHQDMGTFSVVLSEADLEYLQTRGPYALDRYIWKGLQADGLKISHWNGNYLDYVFG